MVTRVPYRENTDGTLFRQYTKLMSIRSMDFVLCHGDHEIAKRQNGKIESRETETNVTIAPARGGDALT